MEAPLVQDLGISMSAVTTPAGRHLGIPAIVSLGIGVATLLAVVVSASIEGDPLPISLLIAAAALPIIMFAGTQALLWNSRYAYVASVLIIIMQSATLRMREIDDKSLDFQIILKLGCLGLMFAMTVSAVVLHRLPLLKRGVTLWVGFLGFTILNSLQAIQPGISLVETASNLLGFLFIYSFIRVLGAQRLADTVIFSCFLLCSLSIIAYFFNPQLGRMSDWNNGVFEPTGRLQGVFGTANSAGAAGAIGILFMILISRISLRSSVFYVLITPMVFCLIVSNNRMSLLAMLVGLFYVYLCRGNAAFKLTIALIAAGVFTLFMAGFGDQILSSVSRSGSTDEITSGTGRSRIWAVVIDLWTDRPLFGYGAGSGKFILPAHPLLFKAAAHAHNLYLNILFSDGAFGLIMFLCALTSTIQRAMKRGANLLIGMMLFFLIYGVTEPTLGGFLGFIPLAFYALLLWTALNPEDFKYRQISCGNVSP